MRAVVVTNVGGPEVLELVAVPDPSPRGPECLVRVLACGVCSHDVATRRGTLKRGIELPVICGHEIAGEILAVGPGVVTRRPGELVVSTQRRRVCGSCRWCRSGRETLCPSLEFLGDVGLNGGYAELVLVEEDNLVPIPENLSPAEACIVACTVGSELNAIRDVARVRAGETVLVTGAGGGLGIHGIQVAAACGARVLATTTTPGKVALLEKLGAEVLLVDPGTDFAERILDHTDGHGVDVAIDNVGSPVFHAVRRSLARGGRWVLVGQLTGDFVSLNPAQLFLRGIDLLSAISTTRQQAVDALDLVSRGLVVPVIEDVRPLAEASDAHRRVESGAVTGRLVLTP
ncbi:alcohol dehydrogenase catalytic domain-containing protein [Nocardioides sp. MAHUQ-72]|uniref:alcohol dehydrogenase catalytic domain-containing protein n=1 Tax=unclassified Nocardioides TaxID=2615069 RepID=UPI00361A812F